MRPLWSYGVVGADRRRALSPTLTARRRALSPTFPAGEMVFFIPWRVVAENPARRISTCRLTCTRRLGGAAAAGRTMVMSPATPDSFAVIFRFGADDAGGVELRGRLRRPPACSLSDISGVEAEIL